MRLGFFRRMAQIGPVATAFSAGLALTCVTGLLVVSPISPANAATLYCQGEHFHYGTGSIASSKVEAERSAIASWAGFTAFEYGNHFADFRISLRRRVDCQKASGGGWQCSVQGIPCRRGETAAGKRRKG